MKAIKIHELKVCPFCGSPIVRQLEDGAHLYCSNPNCPERKIAKLNYFVTKECMNIDGLSEKTLRKLRNTLKIDNSWMGPSDREAVRVPVPADPKSLIQGKTFKFRDYSEYVPTGTDKIPSGYKATGKSKILYEYSFDNAATTVSYYATEYMKDRRLVGTYPLTQEGSVFTFNKDGTDITLVVPAEGLITDGEIMYEENFTDHGPIFVDRVAGAVFTYPTEVYYALVGYVKNVQYKFSDDGNC